MNLIDILMIIIIVLATGLGWRRGFLHSSAGILIWILSLFIILFVSELLARLIESISDIYLLWIRPLGFVILIAVSSPFIFQYFDQVTAKFPEELHNSKMNKFAGLLSGLISGLFFAAVLSIMLQSYLSEPASKNIGNSLIASQLNNYAGSHQTTFKNTLNKFGYYFGRSITIYPKDKEIIRLPFGPVEGSERRNLEKDILFLINEERKKYNLRPLQLDEELSDLARDHSRDMLKRAYFSHYSPEGTNTFQRLQKAGIPYKIGGENLALAENIRQAHYELMSSPVHKANILNEAFTSAGIGIMATGRYGLMITQMFKN